MVIWFAVLIPLLTVLILSLFFSRKMVWWEYCVIFSVPLILITIIRFTTEYYQTSATEYWGGWMTEARYFEDWNERVSCKHPKYETYTDSKGRTHSRFVGYKHLYDVDYHPPYWECVDSNRTVFSIESSKFNDFCIQFKNKTFVDLHRNYHTKNGNKYVTKWMGDIPSLEPTTVSRVYENRVQASDSVFNYPVILNAKELGLYDHPQIHGWIQQAVLGAPGPNAGARELEVLNARYGAKDKVRVYVLIWQGKSMDIAMKQEAYWKNGNKNELIVCIGVDSEYVPQWCKPFGWTPLEDLKIGVRDVIMGQKKLDLKEVSSWLEEKIANRIVRRDFREFAYLSVEPPLGILIMTFILTLLTSVGLAVWAVIRDLGEER